jgi:hypothetical protein
MNLFTRTKHKNNAKTYDKVLSDRAIKKAAKLSIEDQRKLSKQATKLRAQTASR